jgi:hypothetical protein
MSLVSEHRFVSAASEAQDLERKIRLGRVEAVLTAHPAFPNKIVIEVSTSVSHLQFGPSDPRISVRNPIKELDVSGYLI